MYRDEDGVSEDLEHTGLQKETNKKELSRELEESQGRNGSADSMTKGRLLATPSRLFKLIIPLSTVGHPRRQKDIEPIAMLVNPHQPLSYIEHLIQSELSPIEGKDGQLRLPAVSFVAQQLETRAVQPKKQAIDGENGIPEGENGQPPVDKRQSSGQDDKEIASGGPGDAEESRFVRWSQATEIGDFIRDAARAREFVVSIEEAGKVNSQVWVAIPTFYERTGFLRMRLRQISRRLKSLADVKHECDTLAHRGAQRVALGGFGVLAFWWYLVYKLTFETELGWDTMEPVTYLASLTTLMGGYLWFLYHNREISYRSALQFTINKRQQKLYQKKGVDLNLWASLIDEGNNLRREIKNIAAEYDVYWDEKADEQDERVTEALRKDRRRRNGKKDDDFDDDRRER